MGGVETGLSIRFIRAYNAESDRWPNYSLMDVAIWLAAQDTRADLDTATKIADAMRYLAEKRKKAN